MTKLFRRREELAFTVVAYSIVLLAGVCFLAVQKTKESHAALRPAYRVLSVSPEALVDGAQQTVRVLSDGTHFGPRTSVHSEEAGVFFSNIRFVSPTEMSFEVYAHEGRCEGELAVTVRSPKDGGDEERVDLRLQLGAEIRPLELDLVNFGGETSATVPGQICMFGYEPRGYAPFLFTATEIETGRVYTQWTDDERDHLGVRVEPGENVFELTLSDALGREVREWVTVQSEAPMIPVAVLGTTSSHALVGAYSGEPTEWSSDPSEQIPASDCLLGNGETVCKCDPEGGGGGGKTQKGLYRGTEIVPPPRSYLTGIGEAAIGGNGVLLHNGQYREEVEDLYIPGRGLDFSWRRTHRSGNSIDGFLGVSWDFSWGAHFLVDSTTNPTEGAFSRGDGRRDTYSGVVNSVFTTHPQGYYDINTQVYSSSSIIAQKKRNGFTQEFDLVTGRLKKRVDRYGNEITAAYDVNGKMTKITDTLAREITLEYGTSGAENGRLVKITDFSDREVNYEYEDQLGTTLLTKVLYPATIWEDDTSAQPWALQNGVSRTVEYTYSGTKISKVTDGRGKIRVENDYDANDRVTKQKNYSSGTVDHDFIYSLSSGKVTNVTWKNRSDDERVYHFNTSDHLSRKIEVKYTPTGGSSTTAVTDITRGCDCTLPTAIQEPDEDLGAGTERSYTTFDISDHGDVTKKRRYLDTTPTYTANDTGDIRYEAEFAAVDATYYGVVTKIWGPRAFAVGATKDDFRIDITYDYDGNPTTIQYPDTTFGMTTQAGHTYTRTYNSYGQILTSNSPEGVKTTYTYYSSSDTPADNEGYLKEVKVKYGYSMGDLDLVTTYEYYDFGAVKKLTDPKGYVTEYVVDDEFLVMEVKRPKLALATTPIVTKYAYNGERQVIRTDLENRLGPGGLETNNYWTTEFHRGDAGEVLTEKREVSQFFSITWQEIEYAYDDDYRQTLYKDGRDKATKYVLDQRGFAITIERADGTADESIEKRTYNPADHLIKTDRIFRNDGDTTDSHVISRITYDAFHRREKIYDDEDGSGDPDGNYQQFIYDNASNVTEVKHFNSSDTLLRHTTRDYDELDRLIEVERVHLEPNPDEYDTTTYEYDKVNRLVKVTDHNGNITETEYDYASRTTKVIYPDVDPGAGVAKNELSYVYDDNSNVTTKKMKEYETTTGYASSTYEWRMVYDELNRLTSNTFLGNDGTTGYDPVSTVDEYDSRDLVTELTDVDGVTTEYVYDGLGRRTETTLNAGGTVPEPVILGVTYDLANNVTTRTDDAGNRTSYLYDDQNRLEKITHEDDDHIEFTYNDLSQVQTKEYGNLTTDLKKITYEYNELALLTKRTVSYATTPSWTNWDKYLTQGGSESESFVYDGLYRLTDADDDDTRVGLTWNSLDQIEEESLQIKKESGSWTAERTTTSTWDSTGKQRETVNYEGSNITFEYSHDALDRISEIRLSGSPDDVMAQYFYEGTGNRVIERTRGLDLGSSPSSSNPHFLTTYDFDELHRLEEIKHERDVAGGSKDDLRTLAYTWGDGTTGRAYQRSTYNTSGDTTTVNHTYGYDKLGRVTKDTRGGDTYDFDFTQEVAGANNDKDVQFWEELKKNGTAVKSFSQAVAPATPDGSLQMAEYDPTPASSGDELTPSFDIAGNQSDFGDDDFYYDHDNRLVHIDNTASGTDYWFRYDALGRRVGEKEGSTVRFFFYDGSHIVEETDSNLLVDRVSLFGVMLDEVIYSGSVPSSGTLGDHRFPLENHLGSIVAVYDDASLLGSAKQTDIDYTTFGEATVTGEAYPYQFTGRRVISGTDYLDYRTRTYLPEIGRFLQRDSIGIWGDPAEWGNGYAYVGGDPVGRVDPWGFQAATPSEPCSSCCKKAFDTAVGLMVPAWNTYLSALSTISGAGPIMGKDMAENGFTAVLAGIKFAAWAVIVTGGVGLAVAGSDLKAANAAKDASLSTAVTICENLTSQCKTHVHANLDSPDIICLEYPCYCPDNCDPKKIDVEARKKSRFGK